MNSSSYKRLHILETQASNTEIKVLFKHPEGRTFKANAETIYTQGKKSGTNATENLQLQNISNTFTQSGHLPISANIA